MSPRVYLLPNHRQTEIVRRLDPDGVLVDVAALGADDDPAPLARLLADLAGDGGVDVLCLNELAIYLLGHCPQARVPFDARLLRDITKSSQSWLFEAARVPRPDAVWFTLDVQEPPRPYPFVVKPDFGFASQLAMRVRDADDWSTFLAAAAEPTLWPLRRSYANAFLDDPDGALRAFVAEEDLSAGQFLSVPFLYDGSVAVAWIVDGGQVRRSAVTDFQWATFEAPTSLTPAQVATVEVELAALAGAAGCRPGVYEAELIHLGTGSRYLEFSPRPTGGTVPDLVRHAYGVDIDELAVGAFLGEVPEALGTTSPHVYRALRGGWDGGAEDGWRLVSRAGRDSAGRRLVDEIWAQD